MRKFWVSSLAWTLLASSAIGQAVIATRDVSWPNTTGLGSPALDARVHYPIVPGSQTAELLPNPDGYPVVVFLHGFGMLGSDYNRLGNMLAEEGFVAVMLNTAQYSYTQMEADARAIYGAISAANSEPGNFFEGALQADCVGLLGHSMGGAVIAYVLDSSPSAAQSNPGYLCGLGMAPVNPAIAVASTTVEVPIGLVSGQGDTLTPPAAHAVPYYNSLAPTEGLKFHYEMGASCTHMNMVGFTTNKPDIFDRTSRIAVGFFGQFLGGSVTGLEASLGLDGISDPNLANLEMDAAVPQSWSDGPLRLGTSTRISVAAEAGFAGLLAAQATASATVTSFGPLLLDPASAFSIVETYIPGERLDVVLTVPNSLELLGTSFAVQGAGPTVNSVFQLGSAISFVIEQ